MRRKGWIEATQGSLRPKERGADEAPLPLLVASAFELRRNDNLRYAADVSDGVHDVELARSVELDLDVLPGALTWRDDELDAKLNDREPVGHRTAAPR